MMESRAERARILCAGLIAADLVFEIAAFPRKGTKNKALSSRLVTGGGALNAASAIASLGGDVSLAGAVGDDEFGNFLRQKMIERKIDTQFVHVVRGATTSRSANLISADGDRTIVNHRDTSLTPDAFRGSEVFPFDAALVDTRWPEAAAEISAAATRAGKPIVIDAEAPVAPAEGALINASHIVFSEQGLADFCGHTGANALEDVARRYSAWCAVTRGAMPVICHDGERSFEVPGFASTALNTLGAGDVWHGAFTLALGQGRSEVNAVRWANAAAALKVRRSIHSEVLPTASEVAELLETSQPETESKR